MDLISLLSKAASGSDITFISLQGLKKVASEIVLSLTLIYCSTELLCSLALYEKTGNMPTSQIHTRVQDRGTILVSLKITAPSASPAYLANLLSTCHGSQHYHGMCRRTPDPTSGAAWLWRWLILWVPVAGICGWGVGSTWKRMPRWCANHGVL